MIKGHRIERKVDIDHFIDIIKEFKEQDIITTDHTFFRLKKGDRRIFKDAVIREIIRAQNPILVGLQYNKNYAVFYKHEKSILKLIIDVQHNKVKIVTFYIIDQLPRI